ncbi:hypothetical protein OC835_005536 [Tilletia horrida]|nr:hypothetical protein OC835_005536 [Tilletia horrida]KAK0557801.1 hypothetical protein OC844_005482 [Tilletia horrida]
MFNYIPAERRRHLHTYKYSGVDQSLVSRYILGPYWNWLVTLFPTTVAPNTITLSGLLLVGLNFLTLLLHDGALQCGVDSKLDPAANLGNDLKHLISAGQALPVTPFLPRFGLPNRVQPTSVVPGWSLLGFFSSSSDAAANGSTCLPHWVYYTWALGLFLYQSLDSIDGKQARRTGMAGPLGELFDHGCDALNTTLECILVSSALNLGRSYWTLASIIATLSNFYLTTWEEFHTGTLFLSAFSGPVEGILMIVAIYVLTAVAGGPTFWDQGVFNITGLSKLSIVQKTLSGWNMPLSEAFLLFGAIGLGFNVASSYSNVLAAIAKKRKEAGKDASQSLLSSLKPLFGLIPLVVQLAGNTVWATAQRQQIMVDGHIFIPFLSYWGIAFAYNVGLLIVAHVTKAPFPYWNAAAVWSVLGAVDASLPSPLLQSTPARTRLTVYVSLVAATVLYGHFCYHVITTITEEIGVPCFVVRPKKQIEEAAAKQEAKKGK